MPINEWMIEQFMPWMRLKSIERELNAAERIGVTEMKQELWRSQAREALRKFNEPMFFRRFL